MSLFNLPTDTTPEAELLAKGFLAEANQQFETTKQSIYDGMERFWYRNRDKDSNPSLTGEIPSGIEVLQAMGTNAKAFMDVAYARVVMLLTIQAGLGLNEVDMSKIAAPYTLTFAEDGSLESWELK